MIPQEFKPENDNHVATLHVTEARVDFELEEVKTHPLGGNVWALEGGYGQFIHLQVYVPADQQAQFHAIFKKHFRPPDIMEKEVE